MVSILYLERAENELELARIVFKITNDEKLQKEVFMLKKPLTFYSSVISHSYSCISYSAKAYLGTKNVKTEAPEEHKKTYEALKKLVDAGEMDVELLRIYEKIMIRADVLLGIFQKEKSKRGLFTYQPLPQANREPPSESLNNAETFFRNMYNLCNPT
ncbi:MAG: hypothetical protein ABIG95_05170 [Candidatus Woesearchaeota archaeon]